MMVFRRSTPVKELPEVKKNSVTLTVFKSPKFDTELKNYFYYTEVYKDWTKIK
jgi:hypothetical protein